MIGLNDTKEDAGDENVRLSPEHDEYGWSAPGEIRDRDLVKQCAGRFVSSR